MVPNTPQQAFDKLRPEFEDATRYSIIKANEKLKSRTKIDKE